MATKSLQRKKTPMRGGTFNAVRKTFEKWLLITDPTILDVAIGTVVANLFRNNPVWVFLIGPPGSAKSEIVNSCKSTEYVHPLSDLTAQTFASGHGDDRSLLTELDGKVLTFKDFTTVLSKRPDTLDEILSQLREIYDGSFSKAWGSRKPFHWEGHVGMLAGCTEAIDAKRMLHTILGERFVLYRIDIGSRTDVARRALSNTNDTTQMREELSEVVREFLESLMEKEVTLPRVSVKHQNLFIDLADLTAYGRASIPRERMSRTIEYVPSPESPTRLVQIYAMLSQGVALLHGRRQISEYEADIIRKLAADTMLGSRRDLFLTLFNAADSLTTTEVSEKLGVPKATTIRHLEDMWVLGCVKRELEGGRTIKVGDQEISMDRGSQSYRWRLSDEFQKKIEKTDIFRIRGARNRSRPVSSPKAKPRRTSKTLDSKGKSRRSRKGSQ